MYGISGIMNYLKDSILMGNKTPSEDTMRTWFVCGGSEVVEGRLKELGVAQDPMFASIGIHVRQDGSVGEGQIFLSGFKEMGRIQGSIFFGEPLTDNDYVKIASVDMSLFNTRPTLVS